LQKECPFVCYCGKLPENVTKDYQYPAPNSQEDYQNPLAKKCYFQKFSEVFKISEEFVRGLANTI
jgi:hypothetical protein